MSNSPPIDLATFRGFPDGEFNGKLFCAAPLLQGLTVRLAVSAGQALASLIWVAD